MHVGFADPILTPVTHCPVTRAHCRAPKEVKLPSHASRGQSYSDPWPNLSWPEADWADPWPKLADPWPKLSWPVADWASPLPTVGTWANWAQNILESKWLLRKISMNETRGKYVPKRCPYAPAGNCRNHPLANIKVYIYISYRRCWITLLPTHKNTFLGLSGPLQTAHHHKYALKNHHSHFPLCDPWPGGMCKSVFSYFLGPATM
jgi:hypothetical protein